MKGLVAMIAQSVGGARFNQLVAIVGLIVFVIVRDGVSTQTIIEALVAIATLNSLGDTVVQVAQQMGTAKIQAAQATASTSPGAAGVAQVNAAAATPPAGVLTPQP